MPTIGGVAASMCFATSAAVSTAGNRTCRACGAVVHQTLVHLRDNPRTLQVLLVVVNALNLTDFGLTLNALANGASEANPVMASLFKVGPLWAGIFKTAAVLVATALVWECRRYRKALAGRGRHALGLRGHLRLPHGGHDAAQLAHLWRA